MSSPPKKIRATTQKKSARKKHSLFFSFELSFSLIYSIWDTCFRVSNISTLINELLYRSIPICVVLKLARRQVFSPNQKRKDFKALKWIFDRWSSPNGNVILLSCMLSNNYHRIQSLRWRRCLANLTFLIYIFIFLGRILLANILVKSCNDNICGSW